MAEPTSTDKELARGEQRSHLQTGGMTDDTTADVTSLHDQNYDAKTKDELGQDARGAGTSLGNVTNTLAPETHGVSTQQIEAERKRRAREFYLALALDDIEEAYRQALADLAEAKEKLRELEEERDRIQHDLAEAEADLDDARGNNTELRERVERLKEELAENEAQRAAQQTRVDELNQNITRTQQAIDAQIDTTLNTAGEALDATRLPRAEALEYMRTNAMAINLTSPLDGSLTKTLLVIQKNGDYYTLDPSSGEESRVGEFDPARAEIERMAAEGKLPANNPVFDEANAALNNHAAAMQNYQEILDTVHSQLDAADGYIAAQQEEIRKLEEQQEELERAIKEAEQLLAQAIRDKALSDRELAALQAQVDGLIIQQSQNASNIEDQKANVAEAERRVQETREKLEQHRSGDTSPAIAANEDPSVTTTPSSQGRTYPETESPRSAFNAAAAGTAPDTTQPSVAPDPANEGPTLASNGSPSASSMGMGA